MNGWFPWFSCSDYYILYLFLSVLILSLSCTRLVKVCRCSNWVLPASSLHQPKDILGKVSGVVKILAHKSSQSCDLTVSLNHGPAGWEYPLPRVKLVGAHWTRKTSFAFYSSASPLKEASANIAQNTCTGMLPVIIHPVIYIQWIDMQHKFLIRCGVFLRGRARLIRIINLNCEL